MILKQMNDKKPVLPPTYLLISLIIMVGLHLWFPGYRWFPAPFILLGLIPLGGGIAISYVAENQFHRNKTTLNPFEAPSTLVTGGLFRFSRNPMYLGFVLILVGVATLLGSLVPMLVFPVFMILITLKFIRGEERMLAETFEQEWLNYFKKVRRWI
jgi:protein-S-isoprenylcysteine O-methyltransferase Ste14